MKKILIDHKQIKHFEDLDTNLLDEGFIFNECCLIIRNLPGASHDLKVTLYFDTVNKNIQFGIFDSGFNVRHYMFLYHKMLGYSIGRVDDEMEEGEEAAAGYMISLCLDIIQTIKEQSYNKAVYYKKHTEEKLEDIKMYNQLRKKKKRMKLPDLYLSDELTYYAAFNVPEEKLKRSIKCPVWDVRGFYRHYKNGKTVWINSFQKGKDRNKGISSDRTYKDMTGMMPYER